MPLISAFEEVAFPLRIALGASGGPVRQTELVTLGSGYEQRNARWAFSRRRFDAGIGVRSIGDLHEVVSFFEARSGRLVGFRFRDPLVNKSCTPNSQISPDDQLIGEGDGTNTRFQLVIASSNEQVNPPRIIAKPVSETVRIAVDGVELVEGAGFVVDTTVGVVEFQPGNIPQSGETVTAGFEFDIPVRFDTDEITVNLRAFEAGEIPSIPIIEILT